MSKQVKKERCYWCGEKVTSREHVPPVCIFPEKKDIPLLDFRINLITVPSCDKHNMLKSNDDEFLLACMAGVVGNNDIAFVQNQTKVRRIFARRGENFINVISKEPRYQTIKSKNGTDFPVVIGKPDLPRLHKCFEHIARGLYYHEFNSVFKGKCYVFASFITYTDERDQYNEVIKRRFDFDLPKLVVKGTNPDIFKYWVGEPDQHGGIAIKMTFYEGTDIYVSFMKKDFKKQFNLVAELIKSGRKVSVEFPDGKPPVEFN